MKVLCALLACGDVRQRWCMNAFRVCGVEVDIFDYFQVYETVGKNLQETRKQFIEKISTYQPDLLHLQIQHTDIIDGSTLAQIRSRYPKIKISNWTGDVRVYVPETYKDIAQHADFNLISSTGQLSLFEKQLGKKIMYWQTGYDDQLYHPNPEPQNYDYDVVFIANNDYVEEYPGRYQREEACRKLRKAFGNRFGLFGSNWKPEFGSQGSIDQKQVMSVYHRSVCCLSISHFNEIDHYFSDRLLMCMASGRPTVCFKFPKWESYFTNMCDLVIADSVPDIVEKIKLLLNNKDLADFIGQSGADKMYAEHTYTNRVKELLEITGPV